jgi:hypothetical protein
MNLSVGQLDIALQIDAQVRELEWAESDKITSFGEMSALMPGFKQLMDTAGQRGMDELCARFEGFYRYAKIMDDIAAGIESGQIKVPK